MVGWIDEDKIVGAVPVVRWQVGPLQEGSQDVLVPLSNVRKASVSGIAE
jgi:hypothetical protein